MAQPIFPIRSDEDYHESNLDYCGGVIKQFKKTRFKSNAKYSARIYAKCFSPPACPEQFWMYYLVFEVNRKLHGIIPVRKEAFDTLTRDIKPESFASVDFYTIEEFHPTNQK